MKRLVRASAALALLGLSHPLHAFDWGLSTAAGVLTTDNLFRDDSDPQSADIATGEASVLLRERRRNFDLDLTGGVVYRKYGIDGVSDDTLPSINALMHFDISPERFTWALSEQLGQRALNPNDGLLPSDRESVNVMSTGPDVRFPTGPDWWLTMGARVGRVDFGDSPIDNNRIAARIGAEHELRSGRMVSLTLSDARTDFSDTDRQFDIRTAALGYLADGTRGSLNASAGSTWAHDDSGTKGGFFGDLRLERRTGSGAVSLDLVHRLADSADVFRRQQDLEPDINEVLDVVVSDQALRETSLEVSYTWFGRRTSVFLSGIYFSETYFNDFVSANRSGVAMNVQATFQMRPRLALDTRFEWRSEAPEAGDRVQLLQERVGATWTFSQTLGFEAGVENYSRRGSGTRNYDERRLFARIRWEPRVIGTPELERGLRTPASRRATVIR